jgi:hypothetical protein
MRGASETMSNEQKVGPGRKYVNVPPQQQYVNQPSETGHIGGFGGQAMTSSAVKSGVSAGKVFAIMASIIAVTAIVIVIVTVVIPDKAEPFDAIERFETSYNALDYNGLLECIDPRVTKAMGSIASAFSGALGFELDSELIESIMPIAGDYLSEYANEYWDEAGESMSLKITEISTEMNGDNKATVHCRVNFTSSYGNETTEETIKTVKVDGKWYLAAF